MFSRSEEASHPSPPPHLAKYKRPEFGAFIAGGVPASIRAFFSHQGISTDATKHTLGERVRGYVFSRYNRQKYVAMADEYLKAKTINSQKTYDIILIGAGIHAAVFAYTAKRLAPELDILIIEGTSNVCSTFARMGDALILNSPTFSKVGLNSNIVQGHFVQLSDFDELSERPFPTGTHIHTIATMVFFHADADIVFGASVDSILGVGDTQEVVSGTRRFRAKQAVISNGMGQQRALRPGTAQADRQLIQGDEFLAMCRDLHSVGRLIKNKRIAVIGGGDTGNCVVEYLLPLVYPHHNYGVQQSEGNLPRRIVWIGQAAENIQDYFYENKSRYCHSGGLIEFFWHGEKSFGLPVDLWRRAKKLIACVPEKLASVRTAKGCLQVCTKERRFAVDLIINCVERRNPLAEMFLGSEPQFICEDITLYGGQWHTGYHKFVVLPRTIKDARVAVRVDGRNIYIVGAACPLREMIPDDEAKDGTSKFLDERRSLTNSKWSLEHMLPRTVAFATRMALELKAERKDVVCLSTTKRAESVLEGQATL